MRATNPFTVQAEAISSVSRGTEPQQLRARSWRTIWSNTRRKWYSTTMLRRIIKTAILSVMLIHVAEEAR